MQGGREGTHESAERLGEGSRAAAPAPPQPPWLLSAHSDPWNGGALKR
jgi:hypothetical protein